MYKKLFKEDESGKWASIKDKFYEMYPKGCRNVEFVIETSHETALDFEAKRLSLRWDDHPVSGTEFVLMGNGATYSFNISNYVNATFYNDFEKGLKFFTKDFTYYLWLN